MILITLDTVRTDRLGLYGGDTRTSIRLSQLAAGGTTFSNCDSASPLTLPSHTSIFTGLYPPRHGLRSNGLGQLATSVPTLATLLADNGYRTGAFLSSSVLNHRHGLDMGFEIYDDTVGTAGERNAAATVTSALTWWQERDERPVFLWVHLFDAHAPYRPPSPFAQAFSQKPYLGELAFMDAQIGRLLDELDITQQDALVTVIGDHGEGLGDHGEAEHGLLLYQSTLSVPWVIRGPGVPQGRRQEFPVRTIDLLPTLLARLQISPPSELDGRDVLRGETLTAAPAYAETFMPLENYGWHPLFSLRLENSKIQRGAYDTLHDLARDPGEQRDLLEDRDDLNLSTEKASPRARQDRLSQALETIRTPLTPPQVGSDDLEMLEQLRTLGYLGGTAPTRTRRSRPDPRRQTDFHQGVATALAAYRDGSFDTAAASLESLRQQQPENPFLLDLAGSTEMARGRPAAAARFFRESLQRTPQRGTVTVHLAEALLAAGEAPDAEKASREALSHLPEPPPVRLAVTLCQSIAEQGRHQEAAVCALQYHAALEASGDPLLTRLQVIAEGGAAEKP